MTGRPQGHLHKKMFPSVVKAGELHGHGLLARVEVMLHLRELRVISFARQEDRQVPA